MEWSASDKSQEKLVCLNQQSEEYFDQVDELGIENSVRKRLN